MASLPPPRDLGAPVRELVPELASHVGERTAVGLCVELLEGAARDAFGEVLPYLTGHARHDPRDWPDHWLRTWGARGLLYVWDESASPAVAAGLADHAWRPAEMCLKVATRREVAGAGDGAATLSGHRLPRVRAQAMRTLAVVGDTEHVGAVLARLGDEEESVRRAARRAADRLAERLDVHLDTGP